MAIAEVSDMLLAFDEGRVKEFATDYTGTAGKPVYSALRITSVLADAEGQIYLALSKQYSVVEIEADAGIKRLCLDIAMYLLESRKGNPSQVITDAYTRSMKILADLQDGKAKLAAVNQLLPSIATDNGSTALEITSSGLFDGIHDTDYYDND